MTKANMARTRTLTKLMLDKRVQTHIYFMTFFVFVSQSLFSLYIVNNIFVVVVVVIIIIIEFTRNSEWDVKEEERKLDDDDDNTFFLYFLAGFFVCFCFFNKMI